jgi:hypothetical protein
MAQKNLLHLFEFYIALMFLLGLSRRYPIYWDTLRMLIAVKGRWPRLLSKMTQNYGLLVKTEVIRPLVIMVTLMTVQFLCSRLLFPDAEVTWQDVSDSYWRIGLLVLGVVPMIVIDVYFLIFIGGFDRTTAEKSLDQAEHWLGSWKATAVKMATMGYVNPRKIVDAELQKGLVQLRQTVSWTAWWISLQIACRMACGLTIWLLWATKVTTVSS